jgi:hypothetical protein
MFPPAQSARERSLGIIDLRESGVTLCPTRNYLGGGGALEILEKPIILGILPWRIKFALRAMFPSLIISTILIYHDK